MEQFITAGSIKDFEALLIRDEKSAATIEKYIRDVRAFARFLGERPVSKELVVQYKNRIAEKYAPASVNSMLAAVNFFLKSLGLYECTVKTVRMQRQSFRAGEREMSRNEYFRLLGAARKKKDARLYLLMQTICSTGIRVSELRFITVESLIHGKARVSLKGKTRIVLIPKSLIKELSIYARTRGIKQGSIFITRGGKALDRSNILHEMKALCEVAHVDRCKVFPHNLRHLFACLYYKAEKDLSRLADILGHASVDTTRIYTSVSGAEQQRKIDQLGLVPGWKKIPHNINYAVFIQNTGL